MRTIRNELKYSIGLRLKCFHERELRSVGNQFFMRLQKEQQRDNQQKID